MVLTVVSLNAWGLPWPISRDREERFEALAAAPELQADVVGLQEVWSGAPWRSRRPLIRPRARGDSGLGVLSRYPERGTAFLAFDSAGIDRIKRKGVFAVELELPDHGPLWVASIHAQSGRHRAEPRGEQLRQAAGWLDELRDEAPLVWLGDFNLEDHDPVDRETAGWLTEAGFEDAGAETAEPTWHPRNLWVSRGVARYDRIYVKDGARVDVEVLGLDVVLDEAPVSDHYGVRGRLRLRKR